MRSSITGLIFHLLCPCSIYPFKLIFIQTMIKRTSHCLMSGYVWIIEVHHPLTPHRSLENRSTHSRWAVKRQMRAWVQNEFFWGHIFRFVKTLDTNKNCYDTLCNQIVLPESKDFLNHAGFNLFLWRSQAWHDDPTKMVRSRHHNQGVLSQ